MRKLAKAGSCLSASTALTTHLYCYPNRLTLWIYRCISTSSHQVLIYPKQAWQTQHFSGCVREDNDTCPPSLSQITAHPFTVQNITHFGCKSSWSLPIWPTPSFPVLHLLFCPWRMWSPLLARKVIAGSVVVLQVKLIVAFPKKQTQAAVRSKHPARKLTLSHCIGCLPAAL